MLATRNFKTVLLPILLVLFPASFGVTMAVHIAPGIWGQTLFSFCKVWMLGLPLAWGIWVDRTKLHLSLPKKRDLWVGTVLGLLILGVILGAYWIFAINWIDPVLVRTKAQSVGINSPQVYLGGAIYFTLVNSLVEEYIWRYFVTKKCKIILSRTSAICLSALLFTLHHIIALAGYVDWNVVFLGSFGVFLGGAIWSWCYLTYRSIWSSYISHIFADFAIAIVGWQILFG